MINDDRKLTGYVVDALDKRINDISRQLNDMFDDANGHSYGMPEWYNHHDYASGAWKAKHDALQQEFDFLNKLINTLEGP